MNKYAGTDKDIHIRIHKFVVSCFVNVVRVIIKSSENIPIIKQLSASLTSMGANDQEANAADSNRDFIAKYVIVKKETKETIYWLTFLKDTNTVNPETIDTYIREAREIFLIVNKIIQNSKLN